MNTTNNLPMAASISTPTSLLIPATLLRLASQVTKAINATRTQGHCLRSDSIEGTLLLTSLLRFEESVLGKRKQRGIFLGGLPH